MSSIDLGDSGSTVRGSVVDGIFQGKIALSSGQTFTVEKITDPQSSKPSVHSIIYASQDISNGSEPLFDKPMLFPYSACFLFIVPHGCLAILFSGFPEACSRAAVGGSCMRSSARHCVAWTLPKMLITELFSYLAFWTSSFSAIWLFCLWLSSYPAIDYPAIRVLGPDVLYDLNSLPSIQRNSQWARHACHLVHWIKLQSTFH